MKEDNKKEIEITIGSTEKEADYITRKIIEFNDNKIKEERKTEKINLILKNEEGEIFGGILSGLFFNCLRIYVHWVDEEYRNLGYGEKLLLAVEKIAREKGCELIYFSPYSFKNPEFYKKHDYRVIGIEDNFSGGYKRYYLRKYISVELKDREELKVSKEYTADDEKYLIQKYIDEFHKSKAGHDEESEEINLTLKDDKERLIAGILSKRVMEYLWISFLWVDDKYRGLGYGKKLLLELEKIAKEKGYKLIRLDTFSFQAPKFYEKLNYKLIAVEDDCPKGHTHYFFNKEI
ncbi:GNAT family N-acetyltransferase [Wukongibacter baidiensis]|uniref:GNAT family N-acetyltransferase n=1 Tax=Wukongibacter baidiensis TaxID=1723361 RepID=UPI003D7F7700